MVQDEFTCKACDLGWWPDAELAGNARPPPSASLPLHISRCTSLFSPLPHSTAGAPATHGHRRGRAQYPSVQEGAELSESD